MSTQIYKRLFEIKILHEYYLSESADDNYFGLPEDQRDFVLNSKIANRSYDIWKDLIIKPTPSTKNILRGHHLRFIKTKSGFFVGVEVKPMINNAGVEEFFPIIKMTPDVELNFTMSIKNQYFNNYTNLKIDRSTPVICYFNNKNSSVNKVFPSLSEPVQAFQIGTTYEMGELANISGTVKEAVTKTTSSVSTDWQDVKGEGFVNQGDKNLLPHFFNYRFSTPISNAQIVLKKANGSVVKNLRLTDTRPRLNYAIDLRKDQDNKDLGEGEFTLEITGDGNSIDNFKLFLSEEKYIPNGFGTISISTQTSDQDFQIIKNSGALITQRTNGAIIVSHPVFEIRLKSRKTIWRYVSRSGKNLSPTALSVPYLNELAGVLYSKSIRPLLASPINFESENPIIDTIFLPNPANNSIQMDEDRFYSNIYVSKIKSLINE